jgi:hypothetical protein
MISSTQSESDERLTARQRLARLPGKIRELGWGWLFRRSVEVTFGAKGMVLLEAFVRLPVRWLPFVRLFSRDTFFAVYDLNCYPISYDIAWFLVRADVERKRRGLSHLHCIILPIANEAKRQYPPGYDLAVDRTSRRWRLENICISMMQLVPACSGFTKCNTTAQANSMNLFALQRWPELPYGHFPALSVIYRDFNAGLTADEAAWGLKAPEQGLRYIRVWLDQRAGGRKPVVVTLRQYEVDVARNSRTADWIRFLKDLDTTVYFPILVPDTDRAMESSPDFAGITLCTEAAWNLGLRMALYESAYLNMFVNSGPAALCILSPQTRYLMFKIIVPDVYLASEPTLRAMGFESGSTPKFAGPHQRWIWEEDRLDVIRRAFDAMVDKMEAQKPCGSYSGAQ